MDFNKLSSSKWQVNLSNKAHAFVNQDTSVQEQKEVP